MAYTIKNNISFDEYYSIINRVISDCFVDEVYSPAMYELSLRNALISVFCPDFDLSGCEDDNNALWERVSSSEAKVILNDIERLCETNGGEDYYSNIITAIGKGVQHRLAVIESSPMSLSDIALSKLIDVVTAKIDGIDTDVLNKNTINALINADKQSGKEGFEKKLVEEMIAQGLISKPNRTTRRSTSKKKDTKIVKIDTTSSEGQNESK